jgi:hypothetical protein
MPKEAEIRKKAVQVLAKQNWLVWWPAKAIFKQNDIFGIFDLICVKKRAGNLKFIQLTTLPNLSTRKKKIRAFFKKIKINSRIRNNMGVEIWAWDSRNKTFKIEKA